MKFAKTTFVSYVLNDELSKLCTALGESIVSTPPNYVAFIDYLNLIDRLRRSLDEHFSGNPTILDGKERTQINDVLQAKLISLVDDTKHDYSNDVEILLKMCQEIIYGEVKYPNIEIEIKTKDDYSEVRRAKIVKTHFTNVNQGEFASNLGPINAQLRDSGMEEIDEAELRWLLVKANMCNELVTSDDSSHSQYTAIKTEVANKLKAFVENLDQVFSVYRQYKKYMKNLMKAWREIISTPDTVEPKDDVSKYIERLIPKMISNLRNNLVGADNSTVIEKKVLGYEIARKCYKTEDDFKQSLISEDKVRFFANENTSTYDQNTDLSKDAYFKAFKASHLFSCTPDREIVWNLVKDHLDDPLNARAHNLYVYHYLVPSLDRYDYMVENPDTRISNDAKGNIFKLIWIPEMSVPVQVLVLKMLETHTLAGRKGNGIALYWHLSSLGYINGKEFTALNDKPNVVNQFILKAVDGLISTFISEKGDPMIERAYEDNYECLKTLFSGDLKAFPLLK